MKNQLLLLEDVDNLGRSGDIVRAKPGFARNYLIPQHKAVVADKQTLKMQKRLQAEREKKAIEDRKEAEELAKRIEVLTLTKEVKVDPEGHMYGSVSSLDIVHLLEKEGIRLERRHVVLPHPIKTLGEHTISLKLKEGVPAQFKLEIVSETVST